LYYILIDQSFKEHRFWNASGNLRFTFGAKSDAKVRQISDMTKFFDNFFQKICITRWLPPQHIPQPFKSCTLPSGRKKENLFDTGPYFKHHVRRKREDIRSVALKSGCKGTPFAQYTQILSQLFWHFLHKILKINTNKNHNKNHNKKKKAHRTEKR